MKGVLAKVESNSMVIATNLTPICLAYKEKRVKNDSYRRIHKVLLFHWDRKYFN